MWDRKGTPGMQRLLHDLNYIVGECNERLAKGPDPALEALRSHQQDTRDRLAAAMMRKLVAQTELTNARTDLAGTYDEARTRYLQGKAMVHAKFGPRSLDCERFGVRRSNAGPRTPHEVKNARASRQARLARAADNEAAWLSTNDESEASVEPPATEPAGAAPDEPSKSN